MFIIIIIFFFFFFFILFLFLFLFLSSVFFYFFYIQPYPVSEKRTPQDMLDGDDRMKVSESIAVFIKRT